MKSISRFSLILLFYLLMGARISYGEGAQPLFDPNFGLTTTRQLEKSFLAGFDDPRFTNEAVKLRAMERELSQSILSDPKLKLRAPLTAAAVANELFLDGRLQEGIWALDRGGLWAEAEHFSQQLENKFIEFPVSGKIGIGIGASQASFGLISRFPVVIKPPLVSKKTVAAEEWSYRLDRLLGLNIATMGIKVDNYSIHPRLMGARQSKMDMRESTARMPGAIFIFNLLLAVWDRHGGNSLFSEDGRLISIDHGSVYSTLKWSAWREELDWEKVNQWTAKSLPAKAIQQTIARFSPEDFADEYRKYVGSKDLKYAVAKYNILHEYFKKIDIDEAPVRPLSKTERLKYRKIDQVNQDYRAIHQAKTNILAAQRVSDIEDLIKGNLDVFDFLPVEAIIEKIQSLQGTSFVVDLDFVYRISAGFSLDEKRRFVTAYIVQKQLRASQYLNSNFYNLFTDSKQFRSFIEVIDSSRKIRESKDFLLLLKHTQAPKEFILAAAGIKMQEKLSKRKTERLEAIIFHAGQIRQLALEKKWDAITKEIRSLTHLKLSASEVAILVENMQKGSKHFFWWRPQEQYIYSHLIQPWLDSALTDELRHQRQNELQILLKGKVKQHILELISLDRIQTYSQDKSCSRFYAPVIGQ